MAEVHNEDIDTKKLADTLEPMIRRVVREELLNVLKKEILTPDMPLYEDMEDIKLRKDKDQIKLHSHEEVWSE